MISSFHLLILGQVAGGPGAYLWQHRAQGCSVYTQLDSN